MSSLDGALDLDVQLPAIRQVDVGRSRMNLSPGFLRLAGEYSVQNAVLSLRYGPLLLLRSGLSIFGRFPFHRLSLSSRHRPKQGPYGHFRPCTVTRVRKVMNVR